MMYWQRKGSNNHIVKVFLNLINCLAKRLIGSSWFFAEVPITGWLQGFSWPGVAFAERSRYAFVLRNLQLEGAVKAHIPAVLLEVPLLSEA